MSHQTTNSGATSTDGAGSPSQRWYQGMSNYHWWVLFIGALAWTLDTMAQRIFVLARAPALGDLTSLDQTAALVRTYGNYATAAMMIGWAVGGFYFGIVGDKWGRAKTLSMSVLIYSLFTGLSGFSVYWWDFCCWRFLMGCGIGGAFATAATLIAETLPSHSRPFALGMFQALSAVGNITASALAWTLVLPESFYLKGLCADGYLSSLFPNGIPGWRLLFFLGAVPAVLVFLIMKTIKEPETWLAARQNAQDKLHKQMGDIRSMFTDPRWRRNTLAGVALASAGVVGLWGVGFWSPELINEAFKGSGLTREKIGTVKALGTLLQDVGAFFGMFVFTILATRFGRKISFGASFAVALIVVAAVFLTLRQEWQVYVLLPLVGFVTLSVFGGYSIYFPEIYPTRLRSSGTAFCYNAARVLTAAILLFSNLLTDFLRNVGVVEVFRWGAVVLCGFYLLGLLALIWAPETKDRPLPED
ncbi:MAG: MFS transporter [Phycisphaerae bacterium]|nr:MFS transporter [Phycisphaerae bacterium]